MKDKLQQLRSRIDEIDSKLVRLLNDRTKLVLEIGKIKQASGGEIYAPDREEAVFAGIVAKNTGPLTNDSLRAIYREVMSSALFLEKPLIIAYLGPEATYSHMASVRKFGASVRYEPMPSIADVFTDVAKGRADYGVVPIENSTEGAVTHTYDMFTDSELKICAQILLPIRHNLMAACPRDQIRKLYSIAQVFAQCRQWLQVNMPHVELVEVSSSTRAAELVRQEYESGIAEKATPPGAGQAAGPAGSGAGALASALAAEKYGLKIHDENIQDSSENVTRFLVIGRKYPARTGNDKTSIMFAAQDRVGALHDSLATFKRHKINLTKIESRPSKKKAWEYYFFVDCTGHCDDARVKKALAELAKHTMFVKILGSYPNVNG